MLCVYNKDGEIVKDGLLQALNIKKYDKNRICTIGGGGKTTIIEALATAYEKEGQNVVCTTTTKIFAPNYGSLLLEEDMSQLERSMKQEGMIVTIARPWKNQKLTGVSERFLADVMEKYPVVLIEADGSKGLPSKVPNATEPVIPKETTMVLAIQGIDACNLPIKQGCHRPELVAELLNKTEEDVLTTDDMVELFLNPKALKKGCEGKEYWAVIQKVDTHERMKLAKEISIGLQNRGFEHIVITKKQK